LIFVQEFDNIGLSITLSPQNNEYRWSMEGTVIKGFSLPAS
jgi:hypothetical protein